MKWAVLIIAVLAAGLGARQAGVGERHAGPATRFAAVDLFVDSGERPLAAYQVEIKAADGAAQVPPGTTSPTTFTSTEGSIVTLVGVEGGEHAAFKDPPRYDPRALHADQLKERIILAAFNTGADLPKGKVRVARIHVQVEGPEPAYAVVVMAAAGPDGVKINATASAVAAGEAR